MYRAVGRVVGVGPRWGSVQNVCVIPRRIVVFNTRKSGLTFRA